MPQTTVNLRQTEWLAEGQIGDTSIRRIDGAIADAICNVAANAVLPFGRVALLNPTSRLVTALAGAPVAGSRLIIPVLSNRQGATLATFLARPSSIPTTGTIPEADLGYIRNEQVEYLTFGDVVMWSEEAVNFGDPVFYRHTSGAGGTVIGRVRKTLEATNTASFANAAFADNTTAAGLVLVRISSLTVV